MQTDLRRHIDLIAELDALFPLRHFDAATPIDTVRYQSGERNVVEFLKRELLEQDQRGVLGNPNV